MYLTILKHFKKLFNKKKFINGKLQYNNYIDKFLNFL